MTNLRSILVVDDNAAALDAIRRTLEFHGHTVRPAPGAEEALTLANQSQDPPALAILDWVMPTMSGTELARKLRESHPELPILLVSGYTDQELGREAGTMPGVAFLRKPFTIRELMERVEALLSPGPG